MTNEIIAFYGQELITAKSDKDIEYVAMKPLCENLELHWRGQRERIMRDDVLKSSVRMIRTQLQNDLQNRDVLMLHVSYLNGWLFGVDISRLKNEATKERIIVYKKECYKVLHNYWNGEDNRSLNERLERLENIVGNMSSVLEEMNQSFKEINNTLQEIGKNSYPQTVNGISSEITGNLGMAQAVFITKEQNIGENLDKKEKFYKDISDVLTNYPDGISQRTLLFKAGYSQSGKIRRWLQEKISILWNMTIIPGKGYKYTIKS